LAGDATFAALTRARAALEAGDPARALDALAALEGEAAKAMAPWADAARGLVDARAALTALGG
jgi:hypothetical protein